MLAHIRALRLSHPQRHVEAAFAAASRQGRNASKTKGIALASDVQPQQRTRIVVQKLLKLQAAAHQVSAVLYSSMH
ncbi:hypothetical protein, partial [Stenotrophomonas maltophilia]|uniref:hypothetical protein n=1 Tax=Stenotrophomonas maltophilia TaxID=40324 RepID=UPI0013D8E87A